MPSEDSKPLFRSGCHAVFLDATAKRLLVCVEETDREERVYWDKEIDQGIEAGILEEMVLSLTPQSPSNIGAVLVAARALLRGTQSGPGLSAFMIRAPGGDGDSLRQGLADALMNLHFSGETEPATKPEARRETARFVGRVGGDSSGKVDVHAAEGDSRVQMICGQPGGGDGYVTLLTPDDAAVLSRHLSDAARFLREAPASTLKTPASRLTSERVEEILASLRGKASDSGLQFPVPAELAELCDVWLRAAWDAAGKSSPSRRAP